jgi:TPP-dependent 2-oxoacid decarboxylase
MRKSVPAKFSRFHHSGSRITAIPMTHRQYMGGVYLGAISPPRIRKRVEDADLIIALGMLLTDIESGGRAPSEALRDRSIWAADNRVNVSFHTYTDVTLKEFVSGLLRANLRTPGENSL